MKKRQIEILTKLIWDNWRLLFFVFDKRETLVSWPAFVEESEKIPTKELMKKICMQIGDKDRSVIYMEANSSIFYWAFFWKEKYYLLGPMHAQPLFFSEERGYFFKRKIKRKDFPMRELTIIESFSVFSLVYFCITSKSFDTKNILDSQIDDWQQFQNEMLFQKIDWNTRDHTHLSYEVEKKWYRSIVEGNEKFSLGEENEILDRVGIMARGDAKKQLEYMNVAQITLAARAAMEGGVPSVQAYQMSDIFLQKCAECTDAVELLQIAGQSNKDFVSLVRAYQKKNEHDPYVEMYKDYIAKHLKTKISMTQVSEKLGISYSYLAAKFRRAEGISLKKYLIQEKLRAAENLLKYSDADVGEIADYLSFSSASSMCAAFKEQYGMTPLNYRKKNRVRECIK